MSTYDSNKRAIRVYCDDDTGTYEIPGASEVEDWGEVITTVDERDGTWIRRDSLKGWGEWTEVWDVSMPELGDYVYFTGPAK